MTLEARIEHYFDRLWPINRSILGPGFRSSLDILAEVMPTERFRFPTGSQVFDWVVPREWNVREAYIVGPDGKRHAEFSKHNLHLMGYSVPFRGTLSLDELQPHLYSLPNQPNAIPYVTSYYAERWGFCLTHEERLSLIPGRYEVVIDSELSAGHLECGEAFIKGESSEEILFSSYLCHPSLANNELSGPLVTAFVYDALRARSDLRYSYRFAIVPETIGAIAYLTKRGEHLKKHLQAGYTITCIGDPGKFHFKRSRAGDTLADRAALRVLSESGDHGVMPFSPLEGTDERQYCSPGFNLPVGSLMRTPYAKYPQYHTSLDNKDFISFQALAESVQLCLQIVDALEANYTWRNLAPFGEPQLGRRGLYPTVNKTHVLEEQLKAILWLLNLADGEHDLIAIAERSQVPLATLAEVATRLSDHGLLERTREK